MSPPSNQAVPPDTCTDPAPRASASRVIEEVVIPPEVVWHDVAGADCLALFDPRNQRYSELNAVGVEIWRQISRNQPLPEIVAHLAQAFAADEVLIKAEVDRFVRRLLDAGLLIEARASPAEFP